MPSKSDTTHQKLAEWYEAIHPRRIDIVGDFGGKQLFLIDGDSLLLYSLTTSGVDFKVGFQLLHAIFAVESFLSNLRLRGCSFHVVFFDNQVGLCAPADTPESIRYKYQMTRTILVHHLRRHGIENGTKLVFSFPSIDDDGFREYLNQHPATFLLCHDGLMASGKCPQYEAEFQYMVHQFLHLRHSVALIYGTEFKSSRVLMPMITGASRIQSLIPLQSLWPAADPRESDASLQIDLTVYQGRSYRELLTAIALQRVLHSPSANEHYKIMATAMILHQAVISHTRLAERPLAVEAIEDSGIIKEDVETFLKIFCEEATCLIDSSTGDSLATGMHWDIFDLVDGRLLLSLLARLSKGEPIPDMLLNNSKPLFRCVEEWSGVSIIDRSSSQVSTISEDESQAKSIVLVNDSSNATILPFNHEVLNEFLAPVQLEIAELHEEANEGRVFRELTHWHNAKRLIDPKRTWTKPGFHARRRTQRFMADTLAYSASLTGTTGKLIEPKTIVRDKTTAAKKQVSSTAADSRKIPTSREPNKKQRAGAGKDSAREAARATQARKSEKRNTAVLQHWRSVSQELSQERVLSKRFQKTIKLFLNLTSEDEAVIGPEISLYLCDTLYRAWVEQLTRSSSGQALDLGSLLFNQVMRTARMPNLTKEITAVLRILGSTVGILNIESSDQQMISRSLSFETRISENSSLPVLPLAARDFQLMHCGPFLERSFDSRKDDRVPFEPDAWQRSVLDSIDADDSLLVIAPTSSGKTFISFYAMEKILRVDDDSVLVYVAPTKALVNQIAAEIQARFQKTYHHEGRSVWAIHTRDYRVNNPTGCQILVTVPHVLQIMLLSPSHATGNNAWSKRVKRIIFDEVHCIGQDDDGIIWEQLLLMAPCPIIALSATVGNPDEFSEWLRTSQVSKGFNFKMVTHHTRYSDLRAFRYVATEPFEFSGLCRPDRFPVPGLDRPNQTNFNFRFVHPISALSHRIGVGLEDLTLEPRDALTLWESMNRLQNKSFPLDDSLDPSRVFSTMPKKSDVLAWTNKLKDILITWLQDTSSPFDQVCDMLDPGRRGSRQTNYEGGVVEDKPLNTLDRKDTDTDRLSIFALVCGLHKEDGLPAILFNYDRVECERALAVVLKQLESAEQTWKESSTEWQTKMKEYNLWKESKNKRKAPKKPTGKMTKEERMLEEANEELSPWESFNPTKPLPNFSFADDSRLLQSELEEFIQSLEGEHIQAHLFLALRRGIAVHHAGMNRRYRQVVEILFRKGYLTVVIATGTLALGINMPCKTVAFIQDSPFLTALNYKQGAGRAGRRGFDLLGNVVFSNISRMRVHELMSSRLPDLKGHFPLTTTLILRILGLIDAGGQSSFASGIVRSLLTQNRLYLGGAEAGKSIQHHLRFSVEYLQRQHLLSADGKPLNFAGLVGHLYFTENAVFAFHSLLKDGYFHRLCSGINRNSTKTLRTLVLIMSHLFVRIRAPKSRFEAADNAQGSFCLPRLPKEAEDLLIRHNNETLSIFKTYASTFVDQYLIDSPDRSLPLTGIAVGGEQSRILHLPGDLPPTKLRSPFVALSGHSDDFKSIHELCTNIRSGIFLEESVVPYITIWPHDHAAPLNSYIYDFFKHGDFIALTRDNKIKKGDVWFLLKDFSLVIATIVASLTNFTQPGANIDDADMIGLDESGETPDEAVMIEKPNENTVAQPVQSLGDTMSSTVRHKPTKKKVPDSWDDGDDDDDKTGANRNDGDEMGINDADLKAVKEEKIEWWSNGSEDTSEDDADSEEWHGATESHQWKEDGKGLANVLKAFTMLKTEFDDKFRKTWA
ncbi:hypothetical protein F4861DRAFT_32189 [Xylaria intraflava]|nr:hypothetical protein F4861DRAFT_32189 [Xylaria intraflava]